MIDEQEEWFDEYGMVHVHPQPSDSENGILFTAEYILLKYDLNDLSVEEVKAYSDTIKHHEVSEGVYKQTPWGEVDPSSHDNTTAIVTASHVLDMEYHETIKILGHYWHPRDWIYYSWLRGDVWSYPFLPLLFLAFLYMALTKYKYRNGNKILKTDGELLYWVRSHIDKPFMRFCNWIIVPLLKRRFGENYVKGMLEIYFKNTEHPNRKLAEKL